MDHFVLGLINEAQTAGVGISRAKLRQSVFLLPKITQLWELCHKEAGSKGKVQHQYFLQIERCFTIRKESNSSIV